MINGKRVAVIMPAYNGKSVTISHARQFLPDGRGLRTFGFKDQGETE
jgi:hypothetical protein